MRYRQKPNVDKPDCIKCCHSEVIIKRSERVMACLRRGQPAEDDWELYEQAALQREEFENEREECEESGSIECVDVSIVAA